MNLTYQFYTEIWGGSLPESVFNTFLNRAKYILNCITGHRLNSYWEKLEEDQQTAIYMALCAIIDNQYAISQTTVAGGRVTTEIAMNHHVTLAAPTEKESILLRNLIAPYLCGIYIYGYPLMYRGVRKRCSPCC